MLPRLRRLARRARRLPSDPAGQAKWQKDFSLQADDPWGFESSAYERGHGHVAVLFVVASRLGKLGPSSGLELHEHLATHVPLTRVHSETKDDDGPQGIGYRLDVWRR